MSRLVAFRDGDGPEGSRRKRSYAYLGYEPIGERTVGWEYERDDGVLDWYDMEKML